MDIEFQLTPEDLLALAHYHRKAIVEKETDIPQWIWGLLFVASVIVFLFTSHLGIGRSEEIAFGLGCAFMGGFLVFIVFWKYRALVQRKKRSGTDERNRYQYEVKRLTLSPEGITETGSHSVAIIHWPNIWRIAKTDDHAFFFISVDSACIVPRRAFRDQQHFEEFIALARQYQQGRGQQAPKPTGIITGLPPQSDAFTRPDAP